MKQMGARGADRVRDPNESPAGQHYLLPAAWWMYRRAVVWAAGRCQAGGGTRWRRQLRSGVRTCSPNARSAPPSSLPGLAGGPSRRSPMRRHHQTPSTEPGGGPEAPTVPGPPDR